MDNMCLRWMNPYFVVIWRVSEGRGLWSESLHGRDAGFCGLQSRELHSWGGGGSSLVCRHGDITFPHGALAQKTLVLLGNFSLSCLFCRCCCQICPSFCRVTHRCEIENNRSWLKPGVLFKMNSRITKKPPVFGMLTGNIA